MTTTRREQREMEALRRAMRQRLAPPNRMRQLWLAAMILGWPVAILVGIVLWRLAAQATDAVLLLQAALS